ncbi:thiol-disulfide oxidoreductase DCC family protein [Flavisolibacter sp. BT320]|nr:thiol-disulfide oxidoreductase DCC family protein [Flavisolibacter longurius]
MNNHPVVLFDGVCNFCNGSINFLIKQDKKAVFRFAALQSAAGQQLLQAYNLPQKDFESFVFLEKEKVYRQSSAALKLARHLPWYWQWTQVFWLLPKPIRDAAYTLIARNRYKWFGKKEACMVPTPDMRSRFLV